MYGHYDMMWLSPDLEDLLMTFMCYKTELKAERHWIGYSFLFLLSSIAVSCTVFLSVYRNTSPNSYATLRWIRVSKSGNVTPISRPTPTSIAYVDSTLVDITCWQVADATLACHLKTLSTCRCRGLWTHLTSHLQWQALWLASITNSNSHMNVIAVCIIN